MPPPRYLDQAFQIQKGSWLVTFFYSKLPFCIYHCNTSSGRQVDTHKGGVNGIHKVLLIHVDQLCCMLMGCGPDQGTQGVWELSQKNMNTESYNFCSWALSSIKVWRRNEASLGDILLGTWKWLRENEVLNEGGWMCLSRLARQTSYREQSDGPRGKKSLPSYIVFCDLK